VENVSKDEQAPSVKCRVSHASYVVVEIFFSIEKSTIRKLNGISIRHLSENFQRTKETTMFNGNRNMKHLQKLGLCCKDQTVVF
jgi:hypothetical protein